MGLFATTFRCNCSELTRLLLLLLLAKQRDKFDDATKLEKRAIELNQGRAAMMGILALMVHEKLGVSILPNNAPFN
jgi:hypothetical protein